MGTSRAVEDLLRACAPQVLGILVRRHGQFEACEDATQEALIAAARAWHDEGIPEHPRAWLLAVAQRRLIDEWRSESARRRREGESALLEAATVPDVPERDDTLDLLVLCCHPSVSVPSQIALTLRAVGGLTTAEIAAAFLVPEATMAQRISRAKQRIAAEGAEFGQAGAGELAARLPAVTRVLYLVFNEGYAATAGELVHRSELTLEGIRLARLLRASVPDDGEVAGLLALMLLTDARRAARIDADGSLVPLDEQDRRLWDAAMIAEGVQLVGGTLGRGPVGPYQLQAVIAALHDEAASDADTNWPQILALYDVLERVAPGPVVTLNRAVALARVHGPRAALDLLDTLDADTRMTGNHRLHAVRAHLFERVGDIPAAVECFETAARLTRSVQEQRYLGLRAARLRA
ncbi:RNA polymerase sigma factor (sigma-70 family) [Diaminobutyricimonas aerilata]|uniref:RNA polymerase sigma factor (Sigma-70 family) n=2 Tax=Diaminobutyricimonas aerilata TaxID=1162967 RepID=A0A2M9CJZ4_9MICO|nr:sigma-70 family RNA polymerase sigma factor [Diaminobutyricimonas aerilata]PJJ72209.1 RNA polymerase sigma factor (sigma-70 family) [Diaminobutyricimonas aerilata]